MNEKNKSNAEKKEYEEPTLEIVELLKSSIVLTGSGPEEDPWDQPWH